MSETQDYKLIDVASGSVFVVKITKELAAALDIDHHRRYRLINSLKKQGIPPVDQWATPSPQPAQAKSQPNHGAVNRNAAGPSQGRARNKPANAGKNGASFSQKQTLAFLEACKPHREALRAYRVPPDEVYQSVAENLAKIQLKYSIPQLREKMRNLKYQFNDKKKNNMLPWKYFSAMNYLYDMDIPEDSSTIGECNESVQVLHEQKIGDAEWVPEFLVKREPEPVDNDCDIPVQSVKDALCTTISLISDEESEAAIANSPLSLLDSPDHELSLCPDDSLLALLNQTETMSVNDIHLGATSNSHSTGHEGHSLEDSAAEVDISGLERDYVVQMDDSDVHSTLEAGTDDSGLLERDVVQMDDNDGNFLTLEAGTDDSSGLERDVVQMDDNDGNFLTLEAGTDDIVVNDTPDTTGPQINDYGFMMEENGPSDNSTPFVSKAASGFRPGRLDFSSISGIDTIVETSELQATAGVTSSRMLTATSFLRTESPKQQATTATCTRPLALVKSVPSATENIFLGESTSASGPISSCAPPPTGPVRKKSTSGLTVTFVSPEPSPKRKQSALTTVQWPTSAVQVFVAECVAMKESVQVDVDTIPAAVWKKLVAVLARAGFKVAPALCKAKFTNMNNYFTTSLIKSDGVVGGKKWPYYSSFMKIHDMEDNFSFADTNVTNFFGGNENFDAEGEVIAETDDNDDDMWEDGDDESDANNNSNKRTARKLWSVDNVNLLLSAVKLKKKYLLSTKSFLRISTIYAQVAMELSQYGIKVSGKQCRSKMALLTQTFRDEHMKMTRKCTGRPATEWPFYYKMLDIYGNNASLEPPISFSIGRGMHIKSKNGALDRSQQSRVISKPKPKITSGGASGYSYKYKAWARSVQDGGFQHRDNLVKQFALLRQTFDQKSEERSKQINETLATLKSLTETLVKK